MIPKNDENQSSKSRSSSGSSSASSASSSSSTPKGWTILHRCAKKGDVAKARKTIEAGNVDVDAVATDAAENLHEGTTPLHVAAAYDQIEMVRFLVVELGARIGATDRFGFVFFTQKKFLIYYCLSNENTVGLRCIWQ